MKIIWLLLINQLFIIAPNVTSLPLQDSCNYSGFRNSLIEVKKYTKNSVLNDVLNETAYGGDEWETLGGETFDSSKMNGVLKGQYADVVNGSSQPTVDVTTSMGVNPNDPTNSFLTKDYSQTLKAMEKASEKSRG